MRKLAFALFLLMLAACGDRAAIDRLASFGEGKVARVLAADAMVLEDGRTVRLVGITGPAANGAYRGEAQAALEDLVGGREIELLTGGAAKDAYGRTLAHLRRRPDGLWVQGALLDAGAARVRTYADNRALAAEMLEHEARARLTARGLWALPAYRVLLPQEASGLRGFVVAEGRAAAVRAGPAGAEIALSDGGRGIVLRIVPRAVPDFEAAGKAPAALAGRMIRARGTLRADGVIRLDHPESLEVLKTAATG